MAQELAGSFRRRKVRIGPTAASPRDRIKAKTCSFSSASVVWGSTAMVKRARSDAVASGRSISPSCWMAFWRASGPPYFCVTLAFSLVARSGLLPPKMSRMPTGDALSLPVSATDVDQHDLAAVAPGAVLVEVDGLPGAEREVSLHHRDGQGGLGERRADVAGHVVRALGGVVEEPVTVGDEAGEEALEVREHLWVRVLLDHQAGRGVPDEAGDHAGAGTGRGHPQAVHEVGHLAGDVVEPAPAGGECDGVRLGFHRGRPAAFTSGRVRRKWAGPLAETGRWRRTCSARLRCTHDGCPRRVAPRGSRNGDELPPEIVAGR